MEPVARPNALGAGLLLPNALVGVLVAPNALVGAVVFVLPNALADVLSPKALVAGLAPNELVPETELWPKLLWPKADCPNPAPAGGALVDGDACPKADCPKPEPAAGAAVVEGCPNDDPEGWPNALCPNPPAGLPPKALVPNAEPELAGCALVLPPPKAPVEAPAPNALCPKALPPEAAGFWPNAEAPNAPPPFAGVLPPNPPPPELANALVPKALVLPGEVACPKAPPGFCPKDELPKALPPALLPNAEGVVVLAVPPKADPLPPPKALCPNAEPPDPPNPPLLAPNALLPKLPPVLVPNEPEEGAWERTCASLNSAGRGPPTTAPFLNRASCSRSALRVVCDTLRNALSRLFLAVAKMLASSST